MLKFGELYQEGGRNLPTELREEEGIEMAMEKLREASASERAREMIELRRKAEHDAATRLEDARLDGLEQGLQQGLQQGRDDAMREAAKRLRDAGVSDEAIQKATGLGPEDLD